MIWLVLETRSSRTEGTFRVQGFERVRRLSLLVALGAWSVIVALLMEEAILSPPVVGATSREMRSYSQADGGSKGGGLSTCIDLVNRVALYFGGAVDIQRLLASESVDAWDP